MFDLSNIDEIGKKQEVVIEKPKNTVQIQEDLDNIINPSEEKLKYHCDYCNGSKKSTETLYNDNGNVVCTLECQTESNKANDKKEKEESIKEESEFFFTDFSKYLDPDTISEDIIMKFSKVKFEWNNFEVLLKKTNNIEFESYNIVITRNGIYIICFLEFIDGIRAFNVVELMRDNFQNWNFEYNTPLILQLEAKGFVKILGIVKEKQKQYDEFTINFVIEKRMPNRFAITVKSDLAEVGYSIPFTSITSQKISKLIKILINELG